MLEFSAIPVTGADYLTQGAGEINAAGAIALASAIDTADSPNSYWLHTGVPGFTVIGDQTVAWGKQIILGGNGAAPAISLYVNVTGLDIEHRLGRQHRVGCAVDAASSPSNIVWGNDGDVGPPTSSGATA